MSRIDGEGELITIEGTFLLESPLFRKEMACSLLRGEIAFMIGVM